MAFDAHDLSPHEKFVVDRIAAGEVADFTSSFEPGAAKPAIRAGFLRKLLLGLEPAWPVRMPGVRIKGARIEGALDLADCSGAGGAGLPALELSACDLPEPVDISHARLARLSLDQSKLKRLDARECEFDGPVTFHHIGPISVAEPCCLDFEGAHIAGSVAGRGAQLRCDPNEPAQDGVGVFALALRNTRIDGNVLLRPNLVAQGGVSLHGAKISGLVDLRGARLTCNHRYALSAGGMELSGALHLNNGFRCEGPIFLRGARIHDGLHCDGGSVVMFDSSKKLDAINAEGAEIEGGVSLRHGFSCNGDINLRSARISGPVHIDKAKFAASKDYALDLRNASIEGEVSGAAHLDGPLGLAGASITRNLDMRGVEIVSSARGGGAKANTRTAIDAANLRVGGAVLLQGANVKGEAFFADARIEGYFALGGGRFLNNEGWAIRAPNMRVGGNLTIKIDEADSMKPFGVKTVIEGGAKFDRVQIDGALAWLNLEVRGQAPKTEKTDQNAPRGPIFSFADARIGGAIQARQLTAQDALIDFSGASCLALDDDLNTAWGAESTALNLEGFGYGRLEGNGKDDRWKARLQWLRRARAQGFSPQPYAALAQVYERAGRREDARRVLLAQHDLRTRLSPGGPLTWLISSLFGLIAGYGYAPVRVIRAIVLFLALGIAGVLAMDSQRALVNADGQPCRGAIEPALYAVDVALPIIELGQQQSCAPGRAPGADLWAGSALPDSDWRLFEGAAVWKWAQGLYAIFGAILSALAIITFSGVMKQKAED